jgi:hypothetical protein
LGAPGEEVFHDFQILDGVARPKPEHLCADGCVHRLAIRKHLLRNANDLFSPIAWVWLAHGVPSLYKAIDQSSGRSGCQARGLRQFACRASAASRVEKIKPCPLGSLHTQMVGYHLSRQRDLFPDSSQSDTNALDDVRYWFDFSFHSFTSGKRLPKRVAGRSK